MATKLFEPLSSQVPIVDGQGRPNATFSRMLQRVALGAGFSSPNGTISYVIPDGSVVTSMLADGAVTNPKLGDMATKTIKARKTGTTGAPEDCTLSDILDFVGSAAQGDILYRGATGWTRLPAGTSGYFLKTQGAGANPIWATASSSVTWGSITGTLSSQTDLQSALSALAPIASPTFTGTVTAGDVSVGQVTSTSSSNNVFLITAGAAFEPIITFRSGSSSSQAQFFWRPDTSTFSIFTTAGSTIEMRGDTYRLKSQSGGTSYLTLTSTSAVFTQSLSASNLSGTNTGDETSTTILSKLSAASGGGTTNFLRADGAWAAPAGGGGSGSPWWYSPPLSSAFTSFLSSTSTLPTVSDDSNVGMIVNYGSNATSGSALTRVVAKTPPSTGDWWVIAKMKGDIPEANFAAFGLFAVESSSSKFVAMTTSNNSGWIYQSRYGTLNGTAGVGGNQSGGQLDIWYKILFTSATSTYSLYWSISGKTWVFYQSITAATVGFTSKADRVGIGLWTNVARAYNPTVCVENWQQSW